ncbi:glycosyltransferase family 4 protein [Zavarzinella formosa]|uniref:glycosyltransferase family 4 protein n=1 Tax=Zavarzinella formosa TaxID=360055 RepID=UPI0002E9C082|nr:glycosyltransferase family 4 protein [Zavarzinella formosa]
MKIAYLTNQYPHVRHTFIRREIVGLESLGVEVLRFSVRESGRDAVDPADQAEFGKTRALLAAGKAALLSATLKTMLRHPLRSLRALKATIRFGRRSERGVLRHLIYFAEACLLKDWLRKAGAEHLHVHFATNPAVVANLCEQLGGPRYSITVHGPEEWDQPAALSLREKYVSAAFVVAVTDFGRCQIYRWTPLECWPRVHVVRCGVDDGFLKREPTPVPDNQQLVLVAGLVEQKGHLLLLESLAMVAKAGHPFRMIFVGDGHLRPLLERRSAELGLTDRIVFAGWRSNAEVRQFLQESRAMVMPSFAENLPVAMMEALAMGRPVLGTYIAGVPELVMEGKNGLLVPAGNVRLTADAIIRLLTTPVEELTRLGSAGVAKVRESHDASLEAAKMKALFESVLAQRGGIP